MLERDPKKCDSYLPSIDIILLTTGEHVFISFLCIVMISFDVATRFRSLGIDVACLMVFLSSLGYLTPLKPKQIPPFFGIFCPSDRVRT